MQTTGLGTVVPGVVRRECVKEVMYMTSYLEYDPSAVIVLERVSCQNSDEKTL